jgi:dihydrodipicolinate synthase/N-acetylneuraminate lyase
MGHSKALRGLIVDLITPLRESGEIDGRSLGRHLDRILPHVHAVLIASPYAGEGIHLSAPQREDLLDKSLVVIRGQMPLLVWVSQDTEESTKATLLLLQKRVATRRYDGPVFWVDTPLYYHSNRGLFLHYRNLSSLAKEPWMIHNDPELIMKLGRSFKRNNIRTSILKSVAGIEEIQGLVFLGPLERAGNYQKAVRRRPEFRIYDGDELHFLKYPSMSGVVSAGANLAPKAWRKITDASLNLTESRQDYPDDLQQRWETGLYLQKLLETYSPFPVPVIKATLSKMGIIENAEKALGVENPQPQLTEIEEAMKAHGDWES